MPIGNVSLSLLSDDELLAMVTEILEYAKDAPADDKTLQFQIKDLSQKIKTALGLSGKKSTSGLTKQIQNVHKSRGKKRSDLVVCTKGFLRNPNEELKNTAVEVMTEIDKYPLKQSRVPYSVMTNRINSLLKGLEAYAPQIEKLGLTQLITELKEIQENFDQLRSMRVEENKTKKSSTEFNSIMDSIRQKLPKFLAVLDSAEEASPDAFKEIVNDVNVIIEEYFPSAKARNTRKENEKADTVKTDGNQKASSEVKEVLHPYETEKNASPEIIENPSKAE